MFCQKCGNQLNEGAAFCPKCGAIVTVSENSSKSSVGVDLNKKKNKEIPIIITCVTVLLVIIVLTVKGSSGHGAILEPSWVKANQNKGADNPTQIAVAYLKTLNDGNDTRLYGYWDAQLEEEGIRLDTNSIAKLHNDATTNETKTLYLDGAEYEVGNVYTNEKDGQSYENVKVKITCRTEGMFGGESVFTGYDYILEITLHKNRTPDGDKWFLGQMGDQWSVAQ